MKRTNQQQSQINEETAIVMYTRALAMMASADEVKVSFAVREICAKSRPTMVEMRALEMLQNAGLLIASGQRRRGCLLYRIGIVRAAEGCLDAKVEQPMWSGVKRYWVSPSAVGVVARMRIGDPRIDDYVLARA